jgi:hypothetical protein
MVFTMNHSAGLRHLLHGVAFPSFFAELLHPGDFECQSLPVGASSHIPDLVFLMANKSAITEYSPKEIGARKNKQKNFGNIVRAECHQESHGVNV